MAHTGLKLSQPSAFSLLSDWLGVLVMLVMDFDFHYVHFNNYTCGARLPCWKARFYTSLLFQQTLSFMIVTTSSVCPWLWTNFGKSKQKKMISSYKVKSIVFIQSQCLIYNTGTSIVSIFPSNRVKEKNVFLNPNDNGWHVIFCNYYFIILPNDTLTVCTGIRL